MKKLTVLMLSIALCLSMIPMALADNDPNPGDGHDPNEGGQPQATFAGVAADENGVFILEADNYVIEDRQSVNSGDVTISAGTTLTVKPSGHVELSGITLTNYGTVIIESDSEADPPNGSLEIRNDDGNQAEFINIGILTINGQALVNEGAKLTNSDGAAINVNGYLEICNGSSVENGGIITSDGNGEIMLQNPEDVDQPLTITGINFYDDANDDNPTEDLNGGFRFNNGKWVRDGDHDHGPGPGEERPEGDGSYHDIFIVTPTNGTIEAFDMNGDEITPVDNTIKVLDCDDVFFTVTPDKGYRIAEVLIKEGTFVDDQSWGLMYNGDGSFDFMLGIVQKDLRLEFVFSKIEAGDMDDLLSQNFVVLLSEAETVADVQESLSNQFGGYGYVIDPEIIEVTFNDDYENGYGTFNYKIEDSETYTGYIVGAEDVLLFKLTSENGEEIEILAVENMRDLNHVDVAEIEIPSIGAGSMEIFGYGNLIAAPLSHVEKTDDGKILLPFNKAQFHIISFSGGYNIFGLYVIQEDALCVHVDAQSGKGAQRTWHWDLDRYADLTDGDYTSEVFFGNNKFELSLPSTKVGAAESLSIVEGEFEGYRVTDKGDGEFLVEFLSNYYDKATIDLTINGDVPRKLHIHRVGVNIEAHAYIEGPQSFTVFHGTQSSTEIDFSVNPYQVSATYYIPDFGEDVPRLYVTYTWANGTTTTKIIDMPCNNPAPMSKHLFEDGVFKYADEGQNGRVNAVDYMLYEGTKGSAPVKINVTVLKDTDNSKFFEGVSFGSGAGVTWVKD